MKLRTRRLLNRVACQLESAAEYLRRKAERKYPTKPLRFPTDAEVMMERIFQGLMQSQMNSIVTSITKDIPFRPSDKGIRIRIPGDHE